MNPLKIEGNNLVFGEVVCLVRTVYKFMKDLQSLQLSYH